MITSRGVLVGAAAMLLVLGGCAAQPAETSAPEPTETTPPVTETPAPEGSAAVEVTADGFRVLDGGGAVVTEIDLGDDYEPAVEALTTVLGEDPVVTQGDCDQGTSYNWDDKVSVFFYSAARKPPFPRTALTVRTAEVGDVEFFTDGGFAVGDSDTGIISGLPADQLVPNGAFVWDKIVSLDDGTAFGGTAFTDENHTVTAVVPKSTGLNVGC